MKINILFITCLISFQISAQTENKKPRIFLDANKEIVSDGVYINCLKIKELTTIIYLNQGMQAYDKIVVELHRFGTDVDIIAATKVFQPSSKEFQKKYAKLDSLNLKILAEETQFSRSDFDANTLYFPANSTPNALFCKSHDLKHCSFYIIIRGYKKSGEKSQFNEELYDEGTNLSLKSVVFTSWENKTK